jgi:hypothetical protein
VIRHQVQQGAPRSRRKERQALKCSLDANGRDNFNLLETGNLVRVGREVLKKVSASCCTL